MENHHFNGKIHYKSQFSIAMLNYQRIIYIYYLYRRYVRIHPLTQLALTLQKLVSTTSASGVISQSTVKVKRSTSEDKQKKG